MDCKQSKVTSDEQLRVISWMDMEFLSISSPHEDTFWVPPSLLSNEYHGLRSFHVFNWSNQYTLDKRWRSICKKWLWSISRYNHGPGDWWKQMKTSIRIASSLIHIQTRYFWNKSLQCYGMPIWSAWLGDCCWLQQVSVSPKTCHGQEVNTWNTNCSVVGFCNSTELVMWQL